MRFFSLSSEQVKFIKFQKLIPFWTSSYFTLILWTELWNEWWYFQLKGNVKVFFKTLEILSDLEFCLVHSESDFPHHASLHRVDVWSSLVWHYLGMSCYIFISYRFSASTVSLSFSLCIDMDIVIYIVTYIQIYRYMDFYRER